MNIRDEIFNNVFEVQLNMNDVFFFACSMSAKIPGEDFKTLIPFYEEHDYDLFVAYYSLFIDCKPENPAFLYNEYFKTEKFIQDKLNEDKSFCPALQRKLKLRKEEKDMFNGQEVQYREYKLPWLYKKYLKLRGKSICLVFEAYLESGEFARGFTYYKAKEKLMKKYKGK